MLALRSTAASSPRVSLYSSACLERLEVLTSLASEYQTAAPFPHAVIDEFLPDNLLQQIVDSFPLPRRTAHREYDDERQIKLEYHRIEALPDAARDILFFLNSAPVLEALETMTGITGLIPDPHLTGGGLHQIEPGGKLDIHADFNRLERLKLDRRLNLLIYLNRDWKEEFGGHLELWDRNMSSCAKRILPVFNRCVVFSTTDYSYHGHPVPLSCPKGMTRRSLALYYYTNGRPPEEQSEAHSTLFQERPGALGRKRKPFTRRVKKAARALVPPIIMDGIDYLRGRRG